MSKKKERHDVDYLPRSPKEVKELRKKLASRLESAKTNKIDVVVQTDNLRNLEIR